MQTNTSMLGTPFTVTVDLLGCTGIATGRRPFAPWPIPTLAPNGSDAPDISIRSTHKTAESWRVPNTEAAVDLARLAVPAGGIV